jgi:hypothetical protein
MVGSHPDKEKAMFERFTILTMAVLGVVLMLSRPALAAETSHDGKVVSVTEGKNNADGKLVMTDNDGKNEHSHAISSAVKFTLNGKAAKLTDLKKGDSIKVTQDDNKKVTAVAATRS